MNADRTVSCWAADPARVADLVRAVGALNGELGRAFPDVPPLRGEVLEDVTESVLLDGLRSLLPGSRTAEEPAPASLAGRRLLVFLPEEHPFVAEARSHSPNVHWGIAAPRRFAVVWHVNPLLWWHETLHLFGAKDCYNRFGANKCPEPRCVMRAFPMTDQGDGRLRLCGKNLRRIATPPPPGEE